jgi:protein translocase SecG subunit
MTVFPILAVTFIMKIVAVLFILCCVTVILIILIQKGRGGGLSAAFGGGMARGLFDLGNDSAGGRFSNPCGGDGQIL